MKGRKGEGTKGRI